MPLQDGRRIDCRSSSRAEELDSLALVRRQARSLRKQLARPRDSVRSAEEETGDTGYVRDVVHGELQTPGKKA